MEGSNLAAGAFGLQIVGGVSFLHPKGQLSAAMLGGWRNQQLSRNFACSTIESQERAIKAFMLQADAFPWMWSPQMVDEWMGDLRSVYSLRRFTLRDYQGSVRSFCDFVSRRRGLLIVPRDVQAVGLRLIALQRLLSPNWSTRR